MLALAGRTWAATGDPAKGEEFLRRAIDADPSNLDAYSTWLAQSTSRSEKLDQAVAEFDKLAARQPQAVGPPTMAALILQAQGKDDEARQRYERLVEADPRAAVASNNLAWMYASRGEQLDRALQLAQAAKAEMPDHPEVNDTLAFVYLKKQLPSLAIPPLRLAVEKEPGQPGVPLPPGPGVRADRRQGGGAAGAGAGAQAEGRLRRRRRRASGARDAGLGGRPSPPCPSSTARQVGSQTDHSLEKHPLAEVSFVGNLTIKASHRAPTRLS